MSRIALVTGPDAGHALPVLGVGAALAAHDHDVTVWTGPEHADLATRHGLAWRRLARLAPRPGDEQLGASWWDRAADMTAPLVADLRAARADVVVVDTLTRAGTLAAGVLGLPHVEVVPHHLADVADDLPPVGLGRPFPRTPWRAADDRRIVRFQHRSEALGADQGRTAAARVGLAAVPPPRVRLLQTLPSLERPRRSWPTDAHVVGSLALDPLLPRLEPPTGDLPLVVVTDTTASGVAGGLGALAVGALRHLDVRLVVTSSALPPRTAPDVVVGRGPHGPLLDRAALAVSPGGGGFVAKAAAHGVPQVVVPFHGDQREAAARLRDVGAGRVVRRASSRALRWAVVSGLADRSAAAAARTLAAEAAELGPAIAADLVEAVLAGRQPVADGPGVGRLRRAVTPDAERLVDG
ncbi:glycosyl transferase [Nitriliruptoraceae bacterium ZYF776]|nr:glycosyl transferase [Profundirhabdus halotolerans]